ncbi:MAG: GNAT family N-acetyltransferase [Clostridia bacterium]|nr:GNAT family N-acetyltransferase [Clostridia bacterium]
MEYSIAKTYDEVLTAFTKLKSAFFDFNGEIESFAEKIYTNGFCIVCKEEDTAGLIAFYANDYDTNTAYITSLLVDKKCRGMGIATELVQRVESICFANGFKQVKLEVNKANLPAISLYEKLGYKSDSEKEESIYMCKDLEVD